MAERSREDPIAKILEEGEKMYRALFEESHDAILIGTVDGRLVEANKAAVELFGFSSKEELLSKNMGRDLYWNPEDRRRADALFHRQGFLERHEIEFRRADGQRIKVEETASAIRDENGALIGYRGILRDLSERLDLEQQLRQAQRSSAVGRLARGVAHDFNNLLTAINGYSELVLARMEDHDPHRLAVEEIRKAGNRAAEITRRLLSLSRHQEFAPRRLDLNRLVGEMDRLLRRVLGEDVAFETLLSPGLPPVFADASQMEQVLLNLALNARDAMPRGGALVIETHEVRAGDPRPAGLEDKGLARLTVRDNGEGMSPEVLEHAFEPLFSTREDNYHSGLGLSVARAILEESGGQVEIESRPGEGSVIQIYLPLFADDRKSSAARPTETRGRELVLLVEDEAPVRELVRQILELHGYRVVSAADSEMARHRFKSLDEPPELLLTDVVMPGESGVTLATALRREHPGLRILFMSGYNEHHAEIRRLVDEGANFIAKPFSTQDLARKVRQVLDVRPPAS